MYYVGIPIFFVTYELNGKKILYEEQHFKRLTIIKLQVFTLSKSTFFLKLTEYSMKAIDRSRIALRLHQNDAAPLRLRLGQRLRTP
jgi:hypothetical protein